MLSAKEILSTSTIKRLVVEQGRCLKREQRVFICKFKQKLKLLGFCIKITSSKLRVKSLTAI